MALYCKWVTGVISLINGLITGSLGWNNPTCRGPMTPLITGSFSHLAWWGWHPPKCLQLDPLTKKIGFTEPSTVWVSLALLSHKRNKDVWIQHVSYPTKSRGFYTTFDGDGWIFNLPSDNVSYLSKTFVGLFLPHHAKERGNGNLSPSVINSECLKSSNDVQLIIQVTAKLWSLIREPPWRVFFWLGSEDPTLPKKRSGMRKNHQVGWKRYRWWTFLAKNFLAWRYQSLVQKYLWKLISFFRNCIQIPIIQYHFFKDNTTRNWGTNMFS